MDTVGWDQGRPCGGDDQAMKDRKGRPAGVGRRALQAVAGDGIERAQTRDGTGLP